MFKAAYCVLSVPRLIWCLCFALSFVCPQAKYISTCIDEIKQELKQDNIAVKANAVCKLAYVRSATSAAHAVQSQSIRAILDLRLLHISCLQCYTLVIKHKKYIFIFFLKVRTGSLLCMTFHPLMQLHSNTHRG